MSNFWDELMGDDEHAASYMETYGEGVGCDTRHTLGGFISDGETVLDVGCGPGWNYDHFKQYGPKVKWYKGLDYSERFVRVANARHGVKHDNFCDPAPFELGDCRDLKESDNSWDVVILQDCLEHTNGYEKPVKEALRVAKKRVIVSFWHLTENDDHINDDGKDGWGAWYSKPKWEEFLNSLPNVTWMDLDINANDRVRNFYVIRKEGDDE